VWAAYLTLFDASGAVAAPYAVRPLDEQAGRLLEAARDRSPTVRHLLEELARSDLVVYVRFSVVLRPPRATTTLVNAKGPVRFIAVTLSFPNPLPVAIETLAHELMHAVEIASDPSIRTEADLERFYRTHGCVSRHGGGFDSAEAIAVQRRVRREIG
jgi:hypothetical protein